MSELCSICGRGSHPLDDPLCTTPTAGPAGQVAVLQRRIAQAESDLEQANTNWAALVRAQQQRAEAAEAELRKFAIPTLADMTDTTTTPSPRRGEHG